VIQYKYLRNKFVHFVYCHENKQLFVVNNTVFNKPIKPTQTNTVNILTNKDSKFN